MMTSINIFCVSVPKPFYWYLVLGNTIMSKKENQAKELFDGYLKGKFSSKETKQLHDYLDSLQEKDYEWPEDKFGNRDEFVNRMLVEFKMKLRTRSKKAMKIVKYAAIFIGLIGISLMTLIIDNSEDSRILENQISIIEEEPIVLKIGDKSWEINDLEETELIRGNDGKVIATRSGSHLSYNTGYYDTKSNNADKKNDYIEYNEIIVPKGRRFEVTLSDGTYIHLNSDTSFCFPEKFAGESERKVFLAGEAFFEVSSDRENLFIVHNDLIGVKVLGTKFNFNTRISPSPFIVLVEGNLGIQVHEENWSNNVKTEMMLLAPGQIGEYKDDKIIISNVTVGDYTSWKEGELVFVDLPFKDIIKKIERRYNVVIENQYEAINDFRFKGKFKDETIIDLMNVFQKSVGFQYRIVDKTIVILPE